MIVTRRICVHKHPFGHETLVLLEQDERDVLGL